MSDNVWKPTVVLVGLGKFGREYYKELCQLENQDKLILKCVYSKSGYTSLSLLHDLFSIVDLSASSLENVDALIVASSAESHFEVIKKYHAYCHILVEKPIALSVDDIDRYISFSNVSENLIIPAHNYRFNPMVKFARNFFQDNDCNIESLESVFINKGKPRGVDPAQELIHALDIIQFVTRKSILSSSRYDSGDVAYIDCEYDEFIANYKLGFCDSKRRYVNFFLDKYELKIDFVANIVSIFDKVNDTLTKQNFEVASISLRLQLLAFLDAIKQKEVHASFATLDACKETLQATTLSTLTNKTRKLRIAVVGGGIFGCQCAIELSTLGEVDLFERNSSLLSEASFKNQWRHHSGFHYPLSFETVGEIASCKKLFEKEYGDAIVSEFPSYYMVSSSAKEIPPQRYLNSCNYHNLNYSIVPTLDLVNKDSVSLTVLTDESLYDVYVLSDLITNRLKECDINVLLDHVVVGGRFVNGEKLLKYVCNSGEEEKRYDIVINCSYSDFYEMSSLFKVPKKKVRLEVVEMLELEVDIPPVCLTFIDAPFLSLTYMLSSNKFFLTHRDHSVLKRAYKSSGSKFLTESFVSNKDNILNDAIRYMPFLRDSKVNDSWYSFKARSAYEKEFWETPTIVKNHGFGYWSILGGKILTSVKNAKDICHQIKGM